MTATQLALGIFFGFGGLEIFKVVVAMAYENNKRKAAMEDLKLAADNYIDKVHESVIAEREIVDRKIAAGKKQNANQRRPAANKQGLTKAAVKRSTPVRKPAAKKAGK